MTVRRPTKRAKRSTAPVVSGLVVGFDRVEVALGLRHCGERSLLPYDLSRRGDTIELECPGCNKVVISARLDKTETMP
jgi:hypothetical protein